ncbi:helix-turn-helix domain-containing protein [Rhodococcus sp. NPDC003322]
MANEASQWSSLLRNHFVALSLSGIDRDSQFTGKVQTFELSHLRVSRVQSTEQRITRSDILINSDCADYLQIGMVRRGRAQVSQNGRECQLEPGDFVFYETACPFDWRVNGSSSDGLWDLEVFTWPRRSLSFTDTEVGRLTALAFKGSDGTSGLLGRFLHDLAATGVGTSSPIVDEVGDLVSAVLRTAIAPEQCTQADYLFRSATSYIDTNLGDSSMSPTTIAAGMNVSVRHLHRVFAEHGATVAGFVRNRRIEQCRREIAGELGPGLTISRVARKWGFNDLSLFSRTFKKAYGMSPLQYKIAVGGR